VVPRIFAPLHPGIYRISLAHLKGALNIIDKEGFEAVAVVDNDHRTC
jgi:hypothetical protein